MENNEIMVTNEEVIENTFEEEIEAEEVSSDRLGLGMGIGAIATLAGIFIHKKVIKPLWAKHKAKKEAKAAESNAEDNIVEADFEPVENN